VPKINIRHAKQQNNYLKPKLETSFPDSNFIPFVCHFDKNTIITKNGELLQVIRITGFNHESVSSDLANLRETVRSAISTNIKSNNFALWLHTIRRKKSIIPNGNFKDYFSKKLNDGWNNINDWQNQFVNELYLTIIIQGYDTSITNGFSLLRSFSPSLTKKLHIKALEIAHKSLSKTVGNILNDLNYYGAKLIGVKEWDGTLYSSQMSFFGKISNLCEEYFPLTTNDMSEDLTDYKIAFGNQSLEINKDGKKHFATMFSIKEYREVSINSLDTFLQIPQEFIITQSLDFIDQNKALSHFEYQNYILEVSGDEEFRYLSDLEKTMNIDDVSDTSYAKQQITIMLINNTVKGLEVDIDSALNKLHDLGLVTVREDIFFEHCFWSQLPGNFQFLRRQKPIMTSRVAGFASLNNFPAGNKNRNYWGDAVSVFRTVLGTPYFFNFHDGSNGHTLIVGPFGSGKTTLLNFLVCQSRKFDSHLYYFGYNNPNNIFINAIGGNSWSCNNNLENKGALKLNPLSLPDSKENRKFICDWFGYLVNYGKNLVTKDELRLIPKIVDKIYNAKIKKLSFAADMFKRQSTKNIYHKLSIWYGDGKYSFIFDNEKEGFLAENLVNYFSLDNISHYTALIVPTMSYILHKIELSLNNKKTIIVLDEAWKLIDNYAVGPKINDWLARLKEKNCMVIFATESVKDAASSNITKDINHNIATQIFLPDSSPTRYYQTVFGLDNNEFVLLSKMSCRERHFLFKHKGVTVVASLDLDKLSDDLAILSPRSKDVSYMSKAINEFGNDPKDWIPNFYNLLNRHSED
jgi:type IV secretion system protein VirB4